MLQKQNSYSGFTLVELLVVIAIIGLLVGLLIPAVQQAQEAARNIQCSNNLKQLGVAAQTHNASQQCYPCGGWNWDSNPVPDNGLGIKQPGGWLYSLLPFMEQQRLFDSSTAIRNTQVLNFFYCPSRRAPVLYDDIVRCDYVACTGTELVKPKNNSTGISAKDNLKTESKNNQDLYTGVIFALSQIGDMDIYDGTSNTYLCGEKYMNIKCYDNGSDAGDGLPYYGHGQINSRGIFVNNNKDECECVQPPALDDKEHSFPLAFGSAHSGSFNMIFADGSLHRMNYALDQDIQYCLANRQDEGMDCNGKSVNLNYE